MQVMGIIPKKERRKKVDHGSTTEVDGNGIDKLHTIHNSLFNLNEKPTKLFPELAGKLSSDSFVSNNGLVNGLDTTSDNAKGKSPSKSSGSTPRRQKKAARRAMAIIRKKQLGLLSDTEARSMFTPVACQTYSQYVSYRTYNSDLLTPIVDSSDDELDYNYYPPLTYSRMLRKHNLSNAVAMVYSCSASSSSIAAPSPLSPPENDLSCCSCPPSEQSVSLSPFCTLYSYSLLVLKGWEL